MSQEEHKSPSRVGQGEIFNLQHIAFDLEPLSAPGGQEVLRLLARLIARRMRRDELANPEKSMHTMVLAEEIGGRSK
jgi:hypothetical protein